MEIDESKRFFNEIHKLRVNLIKETLEVLGDDYGETLPNVVYHNYLDSSPSAIELLGLNKVSDYTLGGLITNSPEWQEFNKKFADYNGKGIFDVEKIYQLFKDAGANKAYIGAVVEALDEYGEKVGLTNKGKVIVLGQMAHESGYFKYVKEIGGENKSYGQPTGPYNKRYYGRGPIQVTHMANYKMISEKCFPILKINYDIYRNPELCEENLLVGAMASLAWFMIPGNGQYAVKYANDGDIIMCTKMINGGTNGLEDRIRATQKLLQICV